MTEPFSEAAKAIRNAECAIAVTGAGLSVESGISSFRGPEGIWVKYPPEEYATIAAYLSDPEKVWGFWRELGESVKDCKPSPGHYALAELESMGRLHAIITQNVDNLHQEAGSQRVVEYHGNGRRLACLSCGRKEPLDLAHLPERVPQCACGGLMKPDLVLFGEFIPREAMEEAEDLSRQCDVAIVAGTSAQVFPAAQLPVTAKQHGAFIVEANVEETDFTATITDAFLEGPAATTLPELVAHVKA